MADFGFAYTSTNQAEGKVLEKVPGDPGGETYWGLTRRDDGDWMGWKKIDSLRPAAGFPQIAYQDLELSTWHKLYCRDKYWAPLCGDDIKSQSLANKIYDIGFNEGVGEAVQFLQETLNMLNYNSNTGKPYYPDVKVDGTMKPDGETLRRLNDFCGLSMGDYILKSLQIEQGSRYKDIVRSEPEKREFYRGWVNRTFSQGG